MDAVIHETRQFDLQHSLQDELIMAFPELHSRRILSRTRDDTLPHLDLLRLGGPLRAHVVLQTCA